MRRRGRRSRHEAEAREAVDEVMRDEYVGGGEDERDWRGEVLGHEDSGVMEDDAEERREQDMVHCEEHHEEELLPYLDKGKGKAQAVEVTSEEDGFAFRLMDLPAEIRLEIYRACLTRPYKVLLSKARPHYLDAELEEGKAMRFDEDGPHTCVVEDTEDDGDRQALAIAVRSARIRQSSLRNARRSFSRRMTHVRGSSGGWTRTTSIDADPSSSNARSNALRRSRPTTSLSSSSNPRPTQASPSDPLIVNILRTSKQVYKEARGILYSENIFDLSISTAVSSLAALHQRSRRHIKHIELDVPTYSDILERFSEIVRLSLRYCAGLKTFVIHTSFSLPEADGPSNRIVYANGFDILRWLPQQCEVVLKGPGNAEIEAVVEKHKMLAREQDKLAYARRQLISSDGSAAAVFA